MEKTLETNNERSLRIVKKAGRFALEAIAGGVAGWIIADNFMSPDFIGQENVTSALYNYGKQLEYNTIGATIGAIALPAFDMVRGYLQKNN